MASFIEYIGYEPTGVPQHGIALALDSYRDMNHFNINTLGDAVGAGFSNFEDGETLTAVGNGNLCFFMGNPNEICSGGGGGGGGGGGEG